MFSKAFVALAALSFTAAPALAGEPDTSGTTAAPTQAKPNGKDKSHRVCRVVTPSGSRFTTRVCRTAQEWEQEAQRTQDWVADGNRNGSRRDGEFNSPK